MAKFRLTLFVLLLAGMTAFGQAVEISGIGGYTLTGRTNFVDGEVDIFDGGHWGVSLGFEPPESDMLIQFLYMRNSTSGEAIRYFPRPTEIYLINKIVVEHFHIGTERQLGGNEMVRPYGAFSLGLTNYAAREIQGAIIQQDDVARFSIGMGLGVKIFPTEKIGFKAQARMTMPMLFSGVGIFCSSGSGCGGGSSFYVPLVHGEFSGGLVMRLSK